MSKTKTLFTMALLVLLGSMGAAQAQTLARVTLLTDTAKAAREGGKREAAGDVFLDIAGDPESIASYTLTYSVPVILPDDFDTDDAHVYVAAESNLEKGIVAFGAETGMDDAVIAITGIMLDVSEADSGPITVTLELESAVGDLALLIGSDTGDVIDEILLGAKVTAKMDTIRTRGGEAEATFTINEGFKGAFEVEQRIEFEVQGLPEAVTIGMEAVDAKPPNNGLMGEDLMDTPRPVMGAETLTGDADGDDKSVILTLGDGDTNTNEVATARGALSDGVVITLTLMTDGSGVSLPLMVGEITARVTLIDTDTMTDTFDDAFTSPMTIFNIRPAQCELLFPVVTVTPDFGNWTTALSVSNPAYLDEDPVAGGLLFTFYGQGVEATTYDTTVDMITGSGLEPDGTLAPGGTYQVLVPDILAATEWGETFVGHVRLVADYTNCSGYGWVTDFEKVNQGYIAVVLDADTGVSPPPN